MVHKKTDPRYALVRGHIPKVLLKRFKNYCVENELDYSQGIEEILGTFFHLLDKGEVSPMPRQSTTIAELIRDWDLEKLSELSAVKIENLQAIRAGQKPSNDDLIGLGIVLCKENGQPWTTEELIEVCNRPSYHEPDSSEKKESSYL